MSAYASPWDVPEQQLEPSGIETPVERHLGMVAIEAQLVYRRLLLRRDVGQIEGLDHRIVFALGALLDAEEDLAECGLYLTSEGEIVDLPLESQAS